MQKTPLVSVLIPTFNRASLVERAIKSVLKQTYDHFELLIIDDHSTDNTESVIRSFDDDRIKYLDNERKKGAQGARNTGILASQGSYIALLDSDDEWLPAKLKKQMKILTDKRDVDLVYTGQVSIYQDGSKQKFYRKPRENYFKELLKVNCIGPASTVVAKKICFLQIGLFDESLPAKQDYDMWLRLSQEYDFYCIPEPLILKYEFDQKSDKRIYNLTNKIEGSLKILEKYQEYHNMDRGLHAKKLYVIARDMYHNNDYRFFFYLLKSYFYKIYSNYNGFDS